MHSGIYLFYILLMSTQYKCSKQTTLHFS